MNFSQRTNASKKSQFTVQQGEALVYLLVLTLTLKGLFFVNPIFTDGKGTLYDCHFYPKSHSQKKLPSKSLPHLSIRLFWGLRFRPRNPIPLPYILMKSMSPGLCGE